MGQRHGAIAAAELAALRRWREVRSGWGRESAQIVEAELWWREARQLFRCLAIEVAQQPVAQAMIAQAAQLLLDVLKRGPERRPSRKRLVEIDGARIEPHRIEAGEPAHGARQIDVVEH